MKKKMRLRSLLIGAIFTLLFAGLVVRLYWVQVVEASVLLDKAQAAWSEDEVLPAVRGTIYDRRDNVLAQDAKAYTVVVFPKIIHSHQMEMEIVETLSPILNMSSAEGKQKLLSLVTRKKENGEFLSQVEVRSEGWKIDIELANEITEAIEQKGLKGISLIEEQKRYYPVEKIASHILGYTNKEGEAVMGIESLYDQALRGKDGLIRYNKDGQSYELPNSEIQYTAAAEGMSIKLTIDENIQLYMEQAMETAYEQYKPKSMTAIAVDPQTLEVLGMANFPNFNPNKYWDFTDYNDFYNHAVGSQYEPGSTFKIVTLAAAVEEGIFDPNATYKSGKIDVGGTNIHDHNFGRGWGENNMITYLEGLKRSSNVGFVKLGYEGLGASKLREYIDAFGFGQKTGIDLPTEVTGRINFRANVATEIATATFGQGRVSVTAIQQIAAISAIANGGILMQPYIVKEIMDSNTNEIISSTKPKEIRRVISEQTSREVSQYLEQVISDLDIGTGRGAYIEGYRIAGKTGTAQKVIDGSYAADKWIVSFIGYAPVEDPKIALIVIADEPEMNGDYREGSHVVSPVFKEIMAKSLRYYGIASRPEESQVKVSSESNITVPDVVEYSVLGAQNELGKRHLENVVIGSGKQIIKQFPLPGTEFAAGQRIYLLTQEPKDIAVPDFTGMSLRDALQLCSMLQSECEVAGEGYVAGQQMLESSSGIRRIRLELQPLSEIKTQEAFSEELSEEPTEVQSKQPNS